MTGTVTSQLQAVVRVELTAASGRTETVSCALDTGFDGSLALPPDLLASLGSRPLTMEVVVLGDGSEAVLPAHEVTIRWHGQLMFVHTLAIEGGALLVRRSRCEGGCTHVLVGGVSAWPL